MKTLIRCAAVLLMAACAPGTTVVPPSPTATTDCSPTVARMTPPERFFNFVVGGSSRPDITRDQLVRTGNFYGNDALWVLLPDNGEVRVGGDKFLVWRVKTGVVSYVARRLDAAAAEVRATLDARSGYGASGFQPGGVDLPSAGCWEVTYMLDSAGDLRFVLNAR